MKNIHRYVIRYAISLFLHQSHFENKSKCDIAVTCHLFCKKKERYGRVRLLFVISIVIYIESNLILSCIIKSKQNLLFESKCMFQTHSKNKMDKKH